MGMKAHIKGHLHEFFCPFLPTGSYSKSGKYRTNRIKNLRFHVDLMGPLLENIFKNQKVL